MKEQIPFLLIVSAFFMGISTLSATAAQGAQGSGTKLAVVNTLAILQGTAEGKQQLAGLEAFRAQRQQEIQTQSSELQALQQQYQSQARMLNPSTASEMQAEIGQKERQLRRLQEDAELEFNRRQNESLSRVSEKIQVVITEYAEQNGFGAVFTQGPSLPYFAPALDITATIIRIYDEKYPVPGASATTGTTSQNP